MIPALVVQRSARAFTHGPTRLIGLVIIFGCADGSRKHVCRHTLSKQIRETTCTLTHYAACEGAAFFALFKDGCRCCVQNAGKFRCGRSDFGEGGLQCRLLTLSSSDRQKCIARKTKETAVSTVHGSRSREMCF